MKVTLQVVHSLSTNEPFGPRPKRTGLRQRPKAAHQTSATIENSHGTWDLPIKHLRKVGAAQGKNGISAVGCTDKVRFCPCKWLKKKATSLIEIRTVECAGLDRSETTTARNVFWFHQLSAPSPDFLQHFSCCRPFWLGHRPRRSSPPRRQRRQQLLRYQPRRRRVPRPMPLQNPTASPGVSAASGPPVSV